MISAPKPSYLLDREQPRVIVANGLNKSTHFDQKKKFGQWKPPLPKNRLLPEEESFRVLNSGKSKKKCWKRIVTKVTFKHPNFTRALPKYERFIIPAGLRQTEASVTDVKQQITRKLKIIEVKKNPNGKIYSNLKIITKGCGKISSNFVIYQDFLI